MRLSMRKIFFVFIIFCSVVLSTYANDFKKINYKSLKDETKLIYNIESDMWTTKVNKKDVGYLTKYISEQNISEYYNMDGTLAFSTGCNFDFVEKGNLIGYSNTDLKFYDFILMNGETIKRPLSKEEVQALFPKFDVITLSQFSNNTNSLKLKKDKLNYKIILVNDTEKSFKDYNFTTGNAKFDNYELQGFLKINKKGMIQFSNYNDKKEWYILLVR